MKDKLAITKTKLVENIYRCIYANISTTSKQRINIFFSNFQNDLALYNKKIQKIVIFTIHTS